MEARSTLSDESGTRLPETLMQPPMERSASSTTVTFRDNYDALLKEVLEENSEDDSAEELLSNIDIDVNTATADLPDELRAALEDHALADKYLANLKNFMSHQRTHSYGSMTSGKGDYSSPNTPLQSTFPHQTMSPKPLLRMQYDPLSKILDAIPYNTRLVNGVQPLTVLEQKFHASRIPELDLPTISDTIIRARLDDLYKIQDELYIHLHGGPLVKNANMAHNIGEKKKRKILNLLDDIGKEIGLYEEFVKRAQYLTLESILNESDSSSVDEYFHEDNDTSETSPSMNHFDTPSNMSRATSGTPHSSAQMSPYPPSTRKAKRVTSYSTLSTSSLEQPRSSPGTPLRPRLDSPLDSSRHSSEIGTISDRSPPMSLLLAEESSVQLNETGKENMEPWEAFKWTPLKKISDHIYAEHVKKQSGLASVLAVSGVIAIGTTRSLVFVYDYLQNLKCILGNSARAVELGAVTSIAISADHTTIACGHSQGYIVVWDITKPAHPMRVIDPIPAHFAPGNVAAAPASQQQQASRKEGHVKGASILHIGFVGVKKLEIVSGDDQGMAFYHVLYKVVMVNAVDTTRILGRYQNLSFPTLETASELQRRLSMAEGGGSPVPPKPRRPSTVFAMQPLPLGQLAHPAESFGLVALLTPYKMIIVGLKPTPQTQYKFLKPKPFTPPVETNGVLDETTESLPQHQQRQQQQQKDEEVISKPSESLAGCLAWLPVTKSGSTKDVTDKNNNTIATADPLLAFSWGQHLFILQVTVENVDKASNSTRRSRGPLGGKSKRRNKLNFVKYGEYKCKDVIVGLQWINRQILVMLTPNEEMILFDPKNMVETERASLRAKELVYHDRFNGPLHDMLEHASQQDIERYVSAPKTIEMAYYHSLRGYKGTLFLLGLNKLYIGNLLSWADRIIALVRSGDFLEGIELATLFYNGKFTQTVVGLPEDEQARKQLVGEKLMELLVASLNFAFASTRAFETFDDDIAGNGTVLFHDLASGCIKACLSMNNLEFLFDTVYERFCEANVPGAFLQVLEPYILEERVSDVPPAVMKDLVDYYCSKRWISRLEQIIWHVDPQCLDIDQIVSMCHREGMYEAMMYVWNRNMNDYVSPLVDMLKVIRSVLKQENSRFGVSSHPNQREKVRMASIESGKALEYPDQMEEDSDQRQNAEKLFDYLKMIWTGRTYPDGAPMSSSKANEARSAVYTFVFSGRCVVWPRVGGKLVLTADDDEPTYPYLRLLLRFNTKKFLNALETAFEDPWLNGGEDIMTSTLEEETQGKVISRQIIINTLLDVMGGGQSGNALPVPPPRPKQSFSTSTVQSVKSSPTNTTTDSDSEGLVQLYMFIATNLHKYTTFILLPPTVLHKILVRLAEENNTSTRQERQIAVQNLLTVYTPVNEEEMILYYEDAGFWRVLEDVYQRDRKYGKLVEAYLKDDERRDMVFDCVYRLLDSRSDLNEMKRNEVKNVFMIRISQFVEMDGQKTAKVVDKFFDGKHEEAVRRLEEDREFDDDDSHEIADKHVFLYLRGLLEPYASQENEETGSASRGESSFTTSARTSTNVDPRIQERYIELMCRFDPSGVYNYLNTRLDSQVDLKTVQESCEKHGVMDAVVWIMEKSGNMQGALDTMLSVAKEKNSLVLEIIRAHQDDDDRDPQSIWTFEEQGIISSCLIGLSGVLRVGTRLCENSSRRASSSEEEDGSEIESLWFRLLDAYVESSIEVYNALAAAKIPQGLHQHIQSSFKSFVQSILTSLLLSTSPQVSLPRLLLRLIESQTRGDTTFADFRDIFRSMLDTYKYEGKLLEMTNKLFDRDLYRGVQELVRDKARGWRPRRGVCDICSGTILDLTLLQKPLAWDEEDTDQQKSNGDEPKVKDVIVFQCGHAYHRQCLELQQQNGSTTCVICHRGEKPSPSKPETKKEAKGKERERRV